MGGIIIPESNTTMRVMADGPKMATMMYETT